MERFYSSLKLRGTWVCLLVLLTPLALINIAYALTASIGRPYQGKLKNGIPFPRDFRGYTLRDAEYTYTTPEVIGVLLDSVEGVRQQFPDSCDLYTGDFSLPEGGNMRSHRSHQNGRDVDLGMYARGNRYLNRFVPMNEANLDVPKTWQLVENLLQSQKIQYIFVDKKIQRLLYDYALSRGKNGAYLDKLFGNGRGSTIRHLRGHQDHMHVRFFTPWSTMAGQLKEPNGQKKQVIEMAQQAFLPKKVHYYVKGNDSSLRALAQSFGVSPKDLCRWNHLRGNDVLTPGSCLVFYKRGFEVEPVHLAQTMQPNLALESAPIQLASLSPTSLRDLSPKPVRKARNKTKSFRTVTYKVKKGDTLGKIAKINGISLDDLCRLNGIKKKSTIKYGQTLKVGKREVIAPSSENLSAASKSSDKKTRIEKSSRHSTYKVRSGDTLWQIATRNGMDVATLCQLNGFKKNQAIRPGQELKIVASGRSKQPETTRQSLSSSSPKKSAVGKKAFKKTHTIKSGESLWAIAQKYGTDTQTICKLNGFSAKASIQPGMKIKLP